MSYTALTFDLHTPVPPVGGGFNGYRAPKVVLCARAAQVTVEADATNSDPISVQLGIGWPPDFERSPVTWLNPGDKFGPAQRACDAVQISCKNPSTIAIGIVTVETLGLDELGPVEVTGRG